MLYQSLQFIYTICKTTTRIYILQIIISICVIHLLYHIYAWPSYIVYTHTVQSVCMYYICIYHVFSVTVSHILYLHYLDFPEISEITSCFTFWVSSCDVAIIQANIWIWYKYITYTKSYHVLYKYKMHVSSISLNICKSVLYFDSVRIPLTWLNQFQLYIYTSSQSLAASVLFLMFFFLGN